MHEAEPPRRTNVNARLDDRGLIGCHSHLQLANKPASHLATLPPHLPVACAVPAHLCVGGWVPKRVDAEPRGTFFHSTFGLTSATATAPYRWYTLTHTYTHTHWELYPHMLVVFADRFLQTEITHFFGIFFFGIRHSKFNTKHHGHFDKQPQKDPNSTQLSSVDCGYSPTCPLLGGYSSCFMALAIAFAN